MEEYRFNYTDKNDRKMYKGVEIPENIDIDLKNKQKPKYDFKFDFEQVKSWGGYKEKPKQKTKLRKFK